MDKRDRLALIDYDALKLDTDRKETLPALNVKETEVSNAVRAIPRRSRSTLDGDESHPAETADVHPCDNTERRSTFRQ